MIMRKKCAIQLILDLNIKDFSKGWVILLLAFVLAVEKSLE